MMRFWIAGFALAAFGGSLNAQWNGGQFVEPSRSHTRIPPIDDSDPAQLFAERVKQYKLRTDLAGLFKQSNGLSGFDVNRIRKMLEENPRLLEQAKETLKGINLNDPKYSGLIEGILQSNNWNVDPALVRQKLQNFQQGLSTGGGDASAMLIPKPRRSETSGTATLGPVNEETESLRQKWARDLVEWANRFPKDRLAGPLRDSPALKKLMEEIAGAGSREIGGEGLDVQLARWQQRWESFRDWLPKDLPGLNLEGISAPDVRLPNLNLGSPSSGATTVLGTMADLLPVLYVALGVVIVVAIVWLLRSRRKQLDPMLAALGPWPIAPGRVDNRSQLICAFDYLAQLRCGPQAKAWHHRAVAQCLARDAGERGAADELAELYEWARYSPQRGEPSAEVLNVARRRLSQLAEGAA